MNEVYLYMCGARQHRDSAVGHVHVDCGVNAAYSLSGEATASKLIAISV